MQPAYGPITPANHDWYSDQVPHPAQDLAKARQLLASIRHPAIRLTAEHAEFAENLLSIHLTAEHAELAENILSIHLTAEHAEFAEKHSYPLLSAAWPPELEGAKVESSEGAKVDSSEKVKVPVG
jgi:hypothetical protein